MTLPNGCRRGGESHSFLNLAMRSLLSIHTHLCCHLWGPAALLSRKHLPLGPLSSWVGQSSIPITHPEVESLWKAFASITSASTSQPGCWVFSVFIWMMSLPSLSPFYFKLFSSPEATVQFLKCKPDDLNLCSFPRAA